MTALDLKILVLSENPLKIFIYGISKVLNMVTHKLIILTILSAFLISACDYNNYISYNDTTPDPILLRAKPYTEKVIYEDIKLRSLSSSIVADCPSGTKSAI